jgi:hypothetical protein
LEEIMKYLTVAETAKLIRAALKAEFPGQKFSVRSDSYAGGASIRVTWTDGPTVAAVEATAKMYEGATFDGMTDMKSYKETPLAGPDGTVEQVHMGADFVFCTRELSDEFKARLAEVARERLGESFSLTDTSTWYEGTDFDGVERYWQGGNAHCAVRFLGEYIPA